MIAFLLTWAGLTFVALASMASAYGLAASRASGAGDPFRWRSAFIWAWLIALALSLIIFGILTIFAETVEVVRWLVTGFAAS